MTKQKFDANAMECSPDTISGRVREEAVTGRPTGQASSENRPIWQHQLLEELEVMLPRCITDQKHKKVDPL